MSRKKRKASPERKEKKQNILENKRNALQAKQKSESEECDCVGGKKGTKRKTRRKLRERQER